MILNRYRAALVWNNVWHHDDERYYTIIIVLSICCGMVVGYDNSCKAPEVTINRTNERI